MMSVMVLVTVIVSCMVTVVAYVLVCTQAREQDGVVESMSPATHLGHGDSVSHGLGHDIGDRLGVATVATAVPAVSVPSSAARR